MTDIEEIRRAKELLAAGERPKIIAWQRAQLAAVIPARRHEPLRGTNDGSRAEATGLIIAPGLPERMTALIEPVISGEVVLVPLMREGPLTAIPAGLRERTVATLILDLGDAGPKPYDCPPAEGTAGRHAYSEKH